MRGDEPAAVELDLAILADDSKFNCEPEEPAHALKFVLVCEGGADASVVLEEVGENGVGMHGDVSEDVVEDVRLGRVFEGVAGANVGGSRKFARGEHLEEGVGRQESADGCGVPAGARREALVDLGEIGDQVFAEADLVESVEVFRAGVVGELGHAAADELGPDGVLLRGVGGPILLNQIWFGDGKVGGLGGHRKLDSGKTLEDCTAGLDVSTGRAGTSGPKWIKVLPADSTEDGGLSVV